MRKDRKNTHFCGRKLGEEYTGKGSDRKGPTDPVGDKGPKAHGAMLRGCLISVLQGGHGCWYPKPKLTSLVELIWPLPDGAPVQG